MTDRERFSQFLTAILELEELSHIIYRTTAARQDGWRLQLVGLRRQLGDRVGSTAAILDGWTPALAEGEALAERLRREMAALRHALADHQARWPAVSMDTDAPEYKESLGALLAAQMAVRETSQALSALYGLD